MVSALLAELRARDVRVWADGDRLRCNAPAGALTPELREQLQECKDDVLEFLHSVQALGLEQRAIVPLQARGGRTPVFAVAGHNGDVFCYRELAKCLGDDQPFYCLEPPGLDGRSEPLTSVEEMAAYFVGQIRAFQADNSCILAGYCSGGTVAFELARQLRQAGTTVSFLALFGSPYPNWFRQLPQLRYHLERVIKHAGALASRSSWNERWHYISEKLNAKREVSRAAEADPVLMMRRRLEKNTIAAVRRYSPGFFPGRIAIFLPNRKWATYSAAPLRWRRVAQQADQYFGPEDCQVDSMLRERFAPVMAELFAQCRQKRPSQPASVRRVRTAV